MTTEYIAYFAAGLSIVLLFGLIWVIMKFNKMERLRKEFFASGLKKDLEQILIDQNRSISKISSDLKNLDQSLVQLYKDNRSNYQKIGFVRFNPFDDSGGNISFALALLNADGDGLLISSLHGREGTRIYAKIVKNGKSDIKFTEEEVKAIKEAK